MTNLAQNSLAEALTFDDVLLEPAYSEILPAEANVSVNLAGRLPLKIPIISAAMDTVTESSMAIAMAQSGGLGIIHKNFSIEEQCAQVHQVKQFEAGIVVNPKTVNPETPVVKAMEVMRDHNISGLPVVSEHEGILVGILTNRDVRFAASRNCRVSDLMTCEELVTVQEDVDRDEAMRLLHQYRIEKLLVVDDCFRLKGLITVKDIEKAQQFPDAAKDNKGRLRVGAAIGAGSAGIDRGLALYEAGADVLVVDTAHGHSKGVIETVKKLKASLTDAFVIAGNVATTEGAKALADAGADCVKIGIGPGSICTTRIVSGVGVPQLSAIMQISETMRGSNIGLIADGGVRSSGDVAKAIAAGAHCVMLGSMFAGTDEAPGEVFLYQGRSYKSYRGMGSLGAMARGSADRYFQAENTDLHKFVPEGIEGQVPYKGGLSHVIHQLVGGLKASMGYTGNQDLESMRNGCRFLRISQSGWQESHVHNVTITRDAPNYRR